MGTRTKWWCGHTFLRTYLLHFILSYAFLKKMGVQSSRLPSNQQKCVDTLEGRSTHFAASPQCKVSTWDSSTGTVPEFWCENLKKGAFTLVPIDPGSTVHEHRSEGNRLLTRTKYEHNLSYLSLPVRGEWKPWFVHS